VSPARAASGSSPWQAAFGIIAFFVIWEAVVRVLGVPHFVLPPVSAILGRIVTDFGTVASGAQVTLYEALTGFALGTIIGVALAILFVVLPLTERIFLPLLVAVNSVPMVSWTPLALLWFGIGPASKIALVTLVVGFTVLLNTLQGLKSIDPAAVNLLRSFGSSSLGIMWRLNLPAALPAIMVGMRVSTVRSMIIAIIAEMLGAYRGLGWMIYQSIQQIDFLAVWATIFVASLASLIFFSVVSGVERRVVFWT